MTAPKLHRVLGTRDLVLMNIAAIVGLRWLSTAAQVGPSSLVLWILGLVFFFLPVALTVLELSSRIPGEGGLYLWTREAFGDAHGFIAGWSYWVSNIVFFPTVLLFGAGVLLYAGGTEWLHLADSAIYNGICCLTVVWLATFLNIAGLERARWLQNAGGIATWTVAVLILGGGVISWIKFGPATAMAAAALVPDLSSMSALSTFAVIALAFAGLEMGPILGGEIKEPRKTIPRAILITCVAATAMYICGTASLLIALPAEKIHVIAGIPQALAAIGDRLGFAQFGPITAALLALGSFGAVGAFITGTARLPFVIGVDRYLPKALAALHPRYGTPYIALLVQAAITTLVLLLALSGTTIREAFVILVDMTIIVGFLPLLYIFAALPVLRLRAAGKNDGIVLVPGGPVVCWLASGLGFATTLLAIVTSMVPPDGTKDPVMFLVKVIGGSALLIGAGLVFYVRGMHQKAGNKQ
ncbi:MAG: APC family permease [Betaproteobacteria bacterium]